MSVSMKTHPAADLFPVLNGAEYEALKRDIGAHGQQEPIYSFEGQLLDGRNRMRACKDLRIEPWVEALEPSECPDPLDLVMSLNYHRRHLRTHQNGAILAAYMERKGVKRGKGGDRRSKESTATVAVGSIAKTLGIPQRTAERHLKAHDDYKALPKPLKAKVDAGELTPAIARHAAKQIPQNTARDEELPADVVEVFDKAAEDRKRTEALFSFMSRTASGFDAHRKTALRRWSKADRSILCRHLDTILKSAKEWRSELCR